MSFIRSSLVPSFSLVVTLEKIFLIEKVYSELNYKIWRDLARGRKRLIAISCRCPDEPTSTDLFTLRQKPTQVLP